MKRYVIQTIFSLVCCFFLLCMAACSSTPVTSTTGTPGSGQTQTILPGTTPTQASNGNNGGGTQPMPQTQTSCPASGTARAAVMTHLALGQSKTLVYQVNEYSGSTATAGTLKRYDVASGTKTVILGIQNVSIDHAQISQDGQWVLYTADSSAQSELQLVRLDGQGQQTLYCNSHYFTSNPQWSTDQKHIIFSDQNGSQETIYLLTVATGNLQAELTVLNSGAGQGLTIGTWLDYNRVYLTNIAIDQPHDIIYILDTTRGPNQSLSSLPALVHRTFGDFDSSYDGSKLYVDYGYCAQGGCVPPSSITAQPATGGSQTTLISSSTYAITALRAVTASTILLIYNTNSIAGSVDGSQNGLWKINPDGSGLTRLTTDPTNQNSVLNQSSQFPWSNVSRDSQTYALQTLSGQTYTVEYGSLSGGSPTAIASISDGTNLAVAGWTTF